MSTKKVGVRTSPRRSSPRRSSPKNASPKKAQRSSPKKAAKVVRSSPKKATKVVRSSPKKATKVVRSSPRKAPRNHASPGRSSPRSRDRARSRVRTHTKPILAYIFDDGAGSVAFRPVWEAAKASRTTDSSYARLGIRASDAQKIATLSDKLQKWASAHSKAVPRMCWASSDGGHVTEFPISASTSISEVQAFVEGRQQAQQANNNM